MHEVFLRGWHDRKGIEMGFTSIWHWIIVLAVVLILFARPGKISGIMGDFGKGLRSFKEGVKPEEAEEEAEEIAEEIGDTFFSLINFCNKLKVNPENVIAQANAKFLQRFAAMEKIIKVFGEYP